MVAQITLPPLPYAENALEPIISAKTLSVHYGKHHKGYVDKLNELIKDTAFAQKTLEDIIRATVRATADRERKIFNNAGQVWNHTFYWQSLTPGKNQPMGALKTAIERDFGDVRSLTDQMVQAGTDQFGSGWVWLVSRDGKLAVEKTSNAESPMASATRCLLTVDVWEHAYYLDYQQDRPAHLRSVMQNLLNWEFAAQNLQTDEAREKSRRVG